MFTVLFSLLGLGGVGGIAMLILRPALRATVGGFARSIPGWVWKAAAALLLLGGLYWWHSSAVSSAYDRGEVAGKAAEKKEWQVAFAAMKRAAYHWRDEAEAGSDRITELTGALHDQNRRDINARADDLRLRGPGKAAACGRPGADPSLSSSPGGQGSATSPADAPPDRVPAPDRFAIVPWGWLVKSGEDHDELRNEVMTWRSWHDKQKAAHDAAVARLRSEFPEPEFGK